MTWFIASVAVLYMFPNYGDKEKTCQEPNNDSTTTKLYVTVQMKDETKIYVYTHIFKTRDCC